MENISLKNTKLENDLLRRVASLEHDVMLLHAIVAEKPGVVVCDHCDDGHEEFFFPKLDTNTIWHCTRGLVTHGTSWCRQCLNNKWLNISADWEAEEYHQSLKEVAYWIISHQHALIKGSILSLTADVITECRKQLP